MTEDETRDQALVLSGRISTLAEVAEMMNQLSGEDDLFQSWATLQGWLEGLGNTAAADLDRIRRAIGMPSTFN